MAESGGKTGWKADSKSEGKTDSTSETKETSATDTGDGGKTDSSASDASSGYSRGENQKPVTDAFRKNWDDIFSKKPRRRSKK